MNVRSLGRRLALALFFAVALPAFAHAQDPARARDIVLGFFNRALEDGRHNLVDELKNAEGGLEYFEWDQMGLPVAHWGSWEARRVWTARELAAATHHRIHFNLTGFTFGGAKDPLKASADADAGSVGYTTWELAQIRHHRRFWDAADFFERQKDGSYAKLSAKELAKRGLRYEGPELEKLGRLKGKLIRRSPSEEVWSVRGRPGEELVIRLAPTGETEGERDRRAEALVEEKAALAKLATDGVKVAARHETGTVAGELAFVRDALTGPVTAVASGDKTLEVAKDASGELVVAGLVSPRVRPDEEIDSSFATEAKNLLAKKAEEPIPAKLRDRLGVDRALGARAGMERLLDRVRGAADSERDGER